MPRTNTSGQRLTCPNGHTWFYQGDKEVTSCPICKWRVRAQPTRREMTQENRELLPSRRNDRGGLI